MSHFWGVYLNQPGNLKNIKGEIQRMLWGSGRHICWGQVENRKFIWFSIISVSATVACTINLQRTHESASSIVRPGHGPMVHNYSGSQLKCEELNRHHCDCRSSKLHGGCSTGGRQWCEASHQAVLGEFITSPPINTTSAWLLSLQFAMECWRSAT